MLIKTLVANAGLCLALLLSGCGKDEPTTPAKTETPTNQQPTVNHLCDGDKSATYFPVKEGNSWTTSKNTVSTFKGTQSFRGQAYNILEVASGSTKHNRYLRTDASGNIYTYAVYDNNATATKEYMEIPAAPFVGGEWEYPPVLLMDNKFNKRKVTSMTGTFKTAKCEYKDLVIIKEYNADNQVVNTIYFKKGLGIVRETDQFGNEDLTAVTLK